MNMSGNNLSRDLIFDDLHILFTELVGEQETWSHNNDGDGLRSALKALTGVHNAHQGLTTTSRNQDDSTGSYVHSIGALLLVGTKLNHVVLCSVDTTSIAPHGIRERLGVTLCRLVRRGA